MNVGQLASRWRVRVGYPLAIVVLWFARPTPLSILCGGAIGLVGLFIRARAAGYLHKQEVLTVSGPYACTRNPLYFGSAILLAGAAIATHSWISSVVLGVYFVFFYSVVMKREEQELKTQHGARFEEYAWAVPLFLPRLKPVKMPTQASGAFSFAQYRKNREYRAAIGFLLLVALFFLIWRLRLP